MSARRGRVIAIAAAVAAWLDFAACAGGPSIGIRLPKLTRFDAEWRTYKKLPAFKSLAVAGDRDGIYVSGVAYDHRHRESAVEAALRYCEERRIDRRIAAPCETVAIDDQAIVPGLEPGADAQRR
jgi:hypothetical protein